MLGIECGSGREASPFFSSFGGQHRLVLVAGTAVDKGILSEREKVVDGGADDSVVYFHSHEDSTSILRGLTIRNGYLTDFGVVQPGMAPPTGILHVENGARRWSREWKPAIRGASVNSEHRRLGIRS